MLRRFIGWIATASGVLFGASKCAIDWTGRTTFLEDYDALRGKAKPVLEWLERQPDFWFYGSVFALSVVGMSLVFAPELRRTLFGPTKSVTPLSGQFTVAPGPFPDWTVQEVFYHLRPDLIGRDDAPEWKEIGREVQDKLSIGQLRSWGRQRHNGRMDPLAPIDAEYWRHAEFTYFFVGDDAVGLHHAIPADRLSAPPAYADIRMNRSQVLSIWPNVPSLSPIFNDSVSPPRLLKFESMFHPGKGLLSPKDKVTKGMAEIDRLFKDAMDGDKEAYRVLATMVDWLRDNARGFYGSAMAYQGVVAFINERLDKLHERSKR